ncbi:MAG: alpha/beta fold hydrolase [Saprospiraceae bacterium]
MSANIEHLDVQVGKSSYRYLAMGQGETLLLALHGYGERCTIFHPLGKKLPAHYRLASIDLPVHGATDWKKRRFKPKDISELLNAILTQEKREKCEVLGFSFGGRIALCMMEHCSDKISGLYLVAPDGVKVSGLYRVVQKFPDVFRRTMFRGAVNRYTLKLAETLFSRGWMNHHDFRFISSHFQKVARKRLFLYWMSMPFLEPDWQKAKRLIQEKNVKLDVFLATKDEVVPPAAGRMLTKDVDGANIVFLNANHHQLKRAFLKRAEEYFK